MDQFVDTHFPVPDFAGPGVKASNIITLNSLNVKELHLNSPGIGEHRNPGEMSTVIIFTAIATLILLIACINFINLSTARATQRAKEVSLRKVVGASRSQLILQFLGEAILLTSLAFFIALTIVELALPAYNNIIGGQLSIDYTSEDFIILITVMLSVGILSGTYPAFVLSSFPPAENLKANRSSETSSSVKFRTALVVFQFAVTIGLFVSTAVVYGQMQYTKNVDLGYDKENLLVIHDLNREETWTQLNTLVEELRRNPQVVDVTWSRFSPGLDDNNNRSICTQNIPKGNGSPIGHRRIGYNFFKTYNIPMIAGREYDIARDQEVSTDAIRTGNATAKSIIINQSAVKQLGFESAQDAVGSILFKGVGNDAEQLEAEQIIIGVVPDVHFNSLKSTIPAEIYDLRSNSADAISVRFSGDATTIAEAARLLWQKNIATVPFDYDFAEDILAEQYAAEQGQGIMFATFSSLAVLIACLGLFGLASITTERRTKEIGIRKVFGAEVFQIVKLLVWQFSKPVIIANFIAWPISFYLMSDWLNGFAYRVDDLLIFVFCLAGGLAALLIAWLTVAGNSYSVARTNPIKALRYE